METIALDLMGGDNAPAEIAAGAVEASSEFGVAIMLIGTKDALDRHASGARLNDVSIEPMEATQVVGTTEPGTNAWRDKKDSSIAVGVRMVKEGRAQAFVSAGNTGAISAVSLFELGRMNKVERPAIATLYRNETNKIAMLLDIGSNVDCRPKFLLQFGEMGSAFMSKVLLMERPRVGLISNGHEESKGSKLVKEAHGMLKKSDINFIGNVEGFDIIQGGADVFVTDGFTGNVVLKFAESLAGSIFNSLKDALGSNVLTRASKPLWGPPVKSVARQWDYSAVGGAPLLGVNGNIVMSHGRSDASDIKVAIGLAQRMIRERWHQPS